MLTEIEIGLLKLLDNPLTVSGILLHGSWAVGRALPESDFDLICVLQSPREPHRREFKPFQGSNVDVYYASAQVLRKRLQVFNPFNNNFILNAFVDGKVLVDRDGSLAGLAGMARSIWDKGPPRPTAQEIEFSRTQFRAALSAIERSSRHCGNSPEQQGLLRLRCSELFSRMIYEYCRRRKSWATSMANVLNWLQDDSPQLHLLVRSYLARVQVMDLVASLREILLYLERTA
jgi:predicted nucleotidyltransferase